MTRSRRVLLRAEEEKRARKWIGVASMGIFEANRERGVVGSGTVGACARM